MRHLKRSYLALGSGLVSLLLGASAMPAQASPAQRTATLAPAPAVDVRAFRGQGHLAFLWGSRLYLLDGTRGVTRQLPGHGQLTNLTWSSDGRWLAYLSSGALWLARADGSDAHQVAGLPGVAASFAWAPRGETIAVTPSKPGPGTNSLWLVSPSTRPRPVAVRAAAVLWSPDATRFAYGVTLPYRDPQTRSDALYVAPVTGGRPTHLFTAPQSGAWPERWWPNGKGLTFWIDPQHSESLAADGLPLYSMSIGGKPRLLTNMLAYSTWLAWSPSGQQVLLVAGVIRLTWHDKHLAICDVYAATCRALPQPAGVVSLDPAWSPDGSRIAFVRARDRGNDWGFANNAAIVSWVNTRTLWVADASGTGTREIAEAGAGIYEPQWSADGHHLLYIRANSLWLVDTRGGPPRRILGPFPTAPDLYPLGYYGHVSWAGMLAWNRR